MGLGRRILIVAMSTNIASICFVSIVLQLVLQYDAPAWLIGGNLLVFAACVYYIYKATTVWPENDDSRQDALSTHRW